MDDSIPRSIILILMILLGGFFAGAETAFSYCNGVRMRLLAEDGDKRAKVLVKLLDSFEKTVVTLLIAINIIHVIAAAVATVMAVEIFKSEQVATVVSTVVTTLAVFFISETIPKNIAKTNADVISLNIAKPVMFFYYIFTPFSFFFLWLGDITKKIMKIKDDEPTITEDEFATMIENVDDEEVFEPEEKKIIKSAIEFGDLKAENIMMPRDKISGIPINASLAELKKIVLEEKYSRFPVYDGNIDHILGIVQSTSILWNAINGKEIKLRQLIKKPYYVMPETPVSDVFEGMGRKRTHIAIVRSSAGKNVGLITMEDILEEIVGEIYDEDDETVSPLSEGGSLS